MATNSKREQILQAVIAAMEDISWCNGVRRRMMGYAEFDKLARTQVPCIAVTAGMPQPQERRRTGRTGNKQEFRSLLPVFIECYGYATSNHDQVISEYADDVFSAMLDDRTLSGLVVDIQPATASEPSTLVEEHKIAFRMRINVTYLHDNTGI